MKTKMIRLARISSAVFVGTVLSAIVGIAGPEMHGVPNFHAVNDQVYRGGQPSKEGFRNLSAMGIKTVLDLRESGDRSRAEKKLAKSLGMRYVNVPMKGMRTPSDKQISHALKVLNDTSSGPVFVHCKRGADRAGTVVACYRIQHDRWENRKALSEARSHGMSWYELPLIRYVMGYKGNDKSDDLLSEAGRVGDSFREHTEAPVQAVKKLSRAAGSAFGRLLN